MVLIRLSLIFSDYSSCIQFRKGSTKMCVMYKIVQHGEVWLDKPYRKEPVGVKGGHSEHFITERKVNKWRHVVTNKLSFCKFKEIEEQRFCFLPYNNTLSCSLLWLLFVSLFQCVNRICYSYKKKKKKLFHNKFYLWHTYM